MHTPPSGTGDRQKRTALANSPIAGRSGCRGLPRVARGSPAGFAFAGFTLARCAFPDFAKFAWRECCPRRLRPATVASAIRSRATSFPHRPRSSGAFILIPAAVAATLGELPLACTPVEQVATPASARPDPPTATTPLLLKTRAWLVGSFSSARQADEDPNFRSIDLHMVPIWTDRTDGPWLYVEQAVAEAPKRPYRQRIYRLVPVRAANGRDAVLSLVHTLPGDPLEFAGAWRTPERLDAIAPGELALLEGCGVTLEADGPGRIHGSTDGRGCASTFGGGAYTTSEVELFKDRIETLDRGYDAEGVQVWGSEHGPYRFDRVESRSRRPDRG